MSRWRAHHRLRVHLGHDAGELLVAHEHRADSALVVVERVVEATHVAAGDAEYHVDAGFLEHPDDRLGGTRLCVQQFAAHRYVNSDMAVALGGIEPFRCSQVACRSATSGGPLGWRPSRG
jgi:hypothetical protein